MLIGELSKKSGVSRDTIRYYEKMGLLKPVATRANNYKEYPDNAADILKLVKVGKNLGFKLTETIEFLSFWEKNETEDNERLTEMVRNKIAEIDRKIEELAAFKKNLQAALVKCEPGKL